MITKHDSDHINHATYEHLVPVTSTHITNNDHLVNSSRSDGQHQPRPHSSVSSHACTVRIRRIASHCDPFVIITPSFYKIIALPQTPVCSHHSKSLQHQQQPRPTHRCHHAPAHRAARSINRGTHPSVSSHHITSDSNIHNIYHLRRMRSVCYD